MKIITEVEKIDSVFTGSPSPVADNPEACDLCISATEENGVILNWKFRFTIKHIQQLNQFVKKLQSIQDSINYQNNRFYFAEIDRWLHGHKLITRIEYIDFEANVLDVEDIP
ncbi:MAG: hypothetical protein F6K24_05010 [Okeania sp. SIO2D1]|nr:hypothetical protein [Okeania sp. SIO2D1]